MIVAGDIGGTKTYLGLFDWQETRVAPIREEKFWNADFDSFEEILEEFLQPPAPADEGDGEEGEDTDVEEEVPEISPTMPLHSVCFGVAGPVVDNRCRATNLPWTTDTKHCLLYTSPSPRDRTRSRMPSSA